MKNPTIGNYRYGRCNCTRRSCSYYDKDMDGNCSASYNNGTLLPYCNFYTGKEIKDTK